MKTYRFEEIKPRVKHLSKAFKRFIKGSGLEPIWVKEISTRYAFDDSDFTSWHLFFGEDRIKIDEARVILTSFIYKDKPIFSVSGNGWGTGLSVMLNLSSKFD